MEDTRWDRALKVTGGGTGLVGPAGAVLLREAADQARLTVALGAALRKAGASPVLDRGVVLVSMAAAVALGAASMSDIAVLAHLAPVLGTPPSGPTVRRALGLAGTPAMLGRIARGNPGRSTAAGSSPRTSPPTSPPGPASSASAATRTCGKPTRTRSATGSGTSPPGSPATPACAS